MRSMLFSANTPTYRGRPALVFQFSRLVGRPPNPHGERHVVLTMASLFTADTNSTGFTRQALHPTPLLILET